MSPRLPVFLDPWRLADQGKQLSGALALEQMPRLLECVLDETGEAFIELQFGRDEENRRCVSGTVRAHVEVQCQRCLERMGLELEAHVSLSPVETDAEAAQLPSRYEPLLVEGGRLKLAELVEDELLLALPQVPMHETGGCGQGATRAGSDESERQNDALDRTNPFATLAKLKSTNTD